MMTGAVANGIHNIDVSLIIEPVIRAFIMKSADMAGVEYKETFKDDEKEVLLERAAVLMEQLKQHRRTIWMKVTK